MLQILKKEQNVEVSHLESEGIGISKKVNFKAGKMFVFCKGENHTHFGSLTLERVRSLPLRANV